MKRFFHPDPLPPSGPAPQGGQSTDVSPLPEAALAGPPQSPLSPAPGTAAQDSVSVSKGEYDKLVQDYERLMAYATSAFEREQRELNAGAPSAAGPAPQARKPLASFDDEPRLAAYKPEEREQSVQLVRAALRELGLDPSLLAKLPTQVSGIAQQTAVTAYDRDRQRVREKYGAPVVDAVHGSVERAVRERGLSYEDAFLIAAGQAALTRTAPGAPRPQPQPPAQPTDRQIAADFNNPSARPGASPPAPPPEVPMEIRGNPRAVLNWLASKNPL